LSDADRDMSQGQSHGNPDNSRLNLRAAFNVAWPILRLPLLMALLFMFRRPIAAIVFSIFGLDRATLFVINLLSTPESRGLYFCALLIILLTCVAVSRRSSLLMTYIIIATVGSVLFIGACYFTSRSLLFAVPAIVLLLGNLAPANLDSQGRSQLMSLLMVVGVGITELLFFWRHVGWLLRATNRDASTLKEMPRWIWALPGIVFASLASAVLLNGSALVPLEQALRGAPSVRIVANGDDFNWICLDPSHRFLFASGHGLNRIRRYNVMDWSSLPAESDVLTNGAQDFAYSTSNGELYVHDIPNERLLYIDANSLKLKRTADIKGLSPGDAWLAYDPTTDTISVSSEADEEVGSPYMLVDRSSGKVVNTLNDEAGSLLLDPDKSIVYLNYFRRQSGILIYDLKSRTVSHRAELGANADRMAIWKLKEEVLVTLPLESRIARLDAGTLQSKGSFPSMFGVRAIAIDTKDNILLSGSLATGQLDVVDLRNGKRRSSYYLGPWLRTIELLPERGLAYVSSNGSIFEVRYKDIVE
jgi:hypothetical protein